MVRVATLNLKVMTLRVLTMCLCETKFAKVMFLHLSVSHSVHKGGVPARGSALVLGGACSGGSGPGGHMEETPRDGYCCGRYASYWNAFLHSHKFAVDVDKYEIKCQLV